MSKDIFAQWFRAGVQQTPKAIQVRLDNMSMQEAAYYGGAQPYFRYYGIVRTTVYAFLYQDLLIDIKNIDPKTNALTRYRIINIPEPFPDNHYELVLDQAVGT
jgi:hypothetical protein